MKIYIKTPLYKNSKYISHLLEHTTGDWKYVENYFDFISESEVYTMDSYIVWHFPYCKDIEFIKENFLKIPLKNQINYEKKVLKDELYKTSLKLEIEHKIWKILFWKDFNIIKNQKISYEDILVYHKKYFRKDNIIITDDDFNILETNDFLKDFERSLDFDRKKFFLKVKDYPCYIFVKKIENYLDYYLFLFLEFFYENLFSYQIRFQEWFYYYDHKAYSYRIYDANIFCITCEILDFSEGFFEKSKEKFLEIVENWYWKKGKIICKMIYAEDINLDEIKRFFIDFKSDDLKNLIWKEKTYKKIVN